MKKKTQDKFKDKNQNKKKVLLTKKSLHGAIKGLLSDIKRDTTVKKSTNNNLLNPTSFKNKKHSRIERATSNKVIKRKNKVNDSQLEYLEKNGIIYIKSKENKYIPKLTDDEIVARHRKADETMRDVWNKIIEKYENVVDQGDILNLQTGEIIEDHGHLRGENTELFSVEHTTTSYKASINDILYQEEEEKEEKEKEKGGKGKNNNIIANSKKSTTDIMKNKSNHKQDLDKNVWSLMDNDNDINNDHGDADDI